MKVTAKVISEITKQGNIANICMIKKGNEVCLAISTKESFTKSGAKKPGYQVRTKMMKMSELFDSCIKQEFIDFRFNIR